MKRLVKQLAIVILVFVILCPTLLFIHTLAGVKENAKLTHRAGVCFSIGAALERYFHKYGRFPPAVVLGPDKSPYHSWRILIQEFMDTELYTEYDFEHPWDHEKNRKVLNTRNHFAVTESGNGETDFFCVSGPNSFYESCTTDNVPDGIHFLLLEHPGKKALWTEPIDLTPDDIKNETPLGGKMVYLFRNGTHGSI